MIIKLLCDLWYLTIYGICAGNAFLASKVHSFLKMGLSVNIE